MQFNNNTLFLNEIHETELIIKLIDNLISKF